MLVKGDKLIAAKNIMGILDKGDIVEVADVDENGIFSFEFGDKFDGIGFMPVYRYEEFFEKLKVENKVSSITPEYIENIMLASEFTFNTVFDKCTIVSCKLPNGFVIVESSACVNPENYDEEIGADICLEKISNKIWELEGYRLQQELYEERVEAGLDDLHGIPSPECIDCEDYDCEFNPNITE